MAVGEGHTNFKVPSLKMAESWLMKWGMRLSNNIGSGGRRGSNLEWPYKYSRSSLRNGGLIEVCMNEDTDKARG